MDLHGGPRVDGSLWTSTDNWWISMEVHELMDLYGSPQRIDGSPWKSTYCGCTRESMEVHGGVIWCVKCRLSLHRAGSNLCHSARKVSYVKGTEWGRIGAKRRKRLGAASTFSRKENEELKEGKKAGKPCNRRKRQRRRVRGDNEEEDSEDYCG